MFSKLDLRVFFAQRKNFFVQSTIEHSMNMNMSSQFYNGEKVIVKVKVFFSSGKVECNIEVM